jgi:hypothetical protein
MDKVSTGRMFDYGAGSRGLSGVLSRWCVAVGLGAGRKEGRGSRVEPLSNLELELSRNSLSPLLGHHCHLSCIKQCIVRLIGRRLETITAIPKSHHPRRHTTPHKPLPCFFCTTLHHRDHHAGRQYGRHGSVATSRDMIFTQKMIDHFRRRHRNS